MHSTFYECSSVKAPGSISLDSKTNAYITNVCIQKSQTSVEDVPIFLLRPGFSYAADQVSISDSICNGSMINFDSNSQNNKKFKNLNVSHCNSHVTIYSLYTGEDLQNGIFVNNNVTDFLLSFIYDFKMNSIFVTGNSAKDILRFSTQSFDISNSVFSKNIFSHKFIIHSGPGIRSFTNCQFDFDQDKLEDNQISSCQFNVSEFNTPNFKFDECHYIPLPTQTPSPTSTPSQSLPPPTPTEPPPIIIGRDVFTLSTKIVIGIAALLVVAAIIFLIFRRLCKRNHGEVQDNNYLADDLNTEDVIIPEP